MARILMVEDNEMNRDALSRRLQRKGHEVILALDGKQGLALAQSAHPDLIHHRCELSAGGGDMCSHV